MEENVVTEVEDIGLSFLNVRREPKFSTSHITSPVMSVLSKRSWPSPPTLIYGQWFLNEHSVCVNTYWIRLYRNANFMNKDIYASQDSLTIKQDL